jgi:isopenicillin N synthase-like dioxygenase
MTRPFLEGAVERLKNDGFLLIPLAAGARDAVLETLDAAYEFFRAPLEEKSRSRLPEDCGYRPCGIEYSQSPERPDQIESFSATVRTRAGIAQLHSASARRLYDRMLATIDLLEPIAEELTIELADSLSGRSCGQALCGAFRLWSRLQLNYSRPAETAEGLIHDAHEDGDLLTLACATGPGLEMQTESGGFQPVMAPPGQLVIMPGEIAWLLSGGQIRPLWHRVRPLSQERERFALLYFGDIDPRQCEPWVANRINANVDIGARVLRSVTRFGLDGFAQQEGG